MYSLPLISVSAIERWIDLREVGDIVDARRVPWRDGRSGGSPNASTTISSWLSPDALAEVPRDQAGVWMFRRIGCCVSQACRPRADGGTSACWRSSTRWRRVFV